MPACIYRLVLATTTAYEQFVFEVFCHDFVHNTHCKPKPTARWFLVDIIHKWLAVVDDYLSIIKVKCWYYCYTYM